jgi:hypothetical protein
MASVSQANATAPARSVDRCVHRDPGPPEPRPLSACGNGAAKGAREHPATEARKSARPTNLAGHLITDEPRAVKARTAVAKAAGCSA